MAKAKSARPSKKNKSIATKPSKAAISKKKAVKSKLKSKKTPVAAKKLELKEIKSKSTLPEKKKATGIAKLFARKTSSENDNEAQSTELEGKPKTQRATKNGPSKPKTGVITKTEAKGGAKFTKSSKSKTPTSGVVQLKVEETVSTKNNKKTNKSQQPKVRAKPPKQTKAAKVSPPVTVKVEVTEAEDISVVNETKTDNEDSDSDSDDADEALNSVFGIVKFEPTCQSDIEAINSGTVAKGVLDALNGKKETTATNTESVTNVTDYKNFDVSDETTATQSNKTENKKSGRGTRGPYKKRGARLEEDVGGGQSARGSRGGGQSTRGTRGSRGGGQSARGSGGVGQSTRGSKKAQEMGRGGQSTRGSRGSLRGRGSRGISKTTQNFGRVSDEMFKRNHHDAIMEIDVVRPKETNLILKSVPLPLVQQKPTPEEIERQRIVNRSNQILKGNQVAIFPSQDKRNSVAQIKYDDVFCGKYPYVDTNQQMVLMLNKEQNDSFHGNNWGVVKSALMGTNKIIFANRSMYKYNQNMRADNKKLTMIADGLYKNSIRDRNEAADLRRQLVVLQEKQELETRRTKSIWKELDKRTLEAETHYRVKEQQHLLRKSFQMKSDKVKAECDEKCKKLEREVISLTRENSHLLKKNDKLKEIMGKKLTEIKEKFQKKNFGRKVRGRYVGSVLAINSYFRKVLNRLIPDKNELKLMLSRVESLTNALLKFDPQYSSNIVSVELKEILSAMLNELDLNPPLIIPEAFAKWQEQFNDFNVELETTSKEGTTTCDSGSSDILNLLTGAPPTEVRNSNPVFDVEDDSEQEIDEFNDVEVMSQQSLDKDESDEAENKKQLPDKFNYVPDATNCVDVITVDDDNSQTSSVGNEQNEVTVEYESMGNNELAVTNTSDNENDCMIVGETLDITGGSYLSDDDDSDVECVDEVRKTEEPFQLRQPNLSDDESPDDSDDEVEESLDYTVLDPPANFEETSDAHVFYKNKLKSPSPPDIQGNEVKNLGSESGLPTSRQQSRDDQIMESSDSKFLDPSAYFEETSNPREFYEKKSKSSSPPDIQVNEVSNEVKNLGSESGLPSSRQQSRDDEIEESSDSNCLDPSANLQETSNPREFYEKKLKSSSSLDIQVNEVSNEVRVKNLGSESGFPSTRQQSLRSRINSNLREIIPVKNSVPCMAKKLELQISEKVKERPKPSKNFRSSEINRTKALSSSSGADESDLEDDSKVTTTTKDSKLPFYGVQQPLAVEVKNPKLKPDPEAGMYNIVPKPRVSRVTERTPALSHSSLISLQKNSSSIGSKSHVVLKSLSRSRKIPSSTSGKDFGSPPAKRKKKLSKTELVHQPLQPTTSSAMPPQQVPSLPPGDPTPTASLTPAMISTNPDLIQMMRSLMGEMLMELGINPGRRRLEDDLYLSESDSSSDAVAYEVDCPRSPVPENLEENPVDKWSCLTSTRINSSVNWMNKLMGMTKSDLSLCVSGDKQLQELDEMSVLPPAVELAKVVYLIIFEDTEVMERCDDERDLPMSQAAQKALMGVQILVKKDAAYKNLPSLLLEYFTSQIIPSPQYQFKEFNEYLIKLGRFYGALSRKFNLVEDIKRMIFETLYWKPPLVFALVYGILCLNSDIFSVLPFEKFGFTDRAILFALINAPEFNDAKRFPHVQSLLKQSLQIVIPEFTYQQFVDSMLLEMTVMEEDTMLKKASKAISMLCLQARWDWFEGFIKKKLLEWIQGWSQGAITDAVFASFINVIGDVSNDSIVHADVSGLRDVVNTLKKINTNIMHPILKDAIQIAYSKIEQKIQKMQTVQPNVWSYDKKYTVTNKSIKKKKKGKKKAAAKKALNVRQKDMIKAAAEMLTKQ